MDRSSESKLGSRGDDVVSEELVRVARSGGNASSVSAGLAGSWCRREVRR
jgi:hypothetical protein